MGNNLFSVLPLFRIIRTPFNIPFLEQTLLIAWRGGMMPLSVLFSAVTSKDVVRDLPLMEENQESVFQGKIVVTLSENIVRDDMTFITDISFY